MQHRHRRWGSRLLALGLLAQGCIPADPPSLAPPPELTRPADDLADVGRLGPEVRCDQPLSGFDRFTEQAQERGLTVPHLPPTALNVPSSSFGGGGVVQDLDGDGDLDVVAILLNGEPVVYENDGDARFTRVPQPDWPLSSNPMSLVVAQGAVDLDGDGLPELLMGGIGRAMGAHNLGGMRFAPPTVLVPRPPEQSRWALYATLLVGDLDGDDDLDLILPGFAAVASGPSDALGAPDRVALQGDGGVFTVVEELAPYGTPGASFVGTMTDRDGDGDLDVFIASEGARDGTPPSLFLRNDGPAEGGRPRLVDDAPELGADLAISGMGLATWDLNDDGALDYCLTDTGPLACLLSDGQGAYVEGGLSLGLRPAAADEIMFWSVELADLDNDGVVDAVAAGGPPGGPEAQQLGQDFTDQPDVIWQGARSADGALTFTDRSAELGFGDTEDHYGLVTADLDGDGALDVLILGNSSPPTLWMNRCGAEGWLEVELEGPPGNREGWGARLEVTIDGHRQLQELQAIRGFAQGPSRFHVGAGEAEAIDELVLTWPDGERVVLRDVPLRRRLTLRHPRAG